MPFGAHETMQVHEILNGNIHTINHLGFYAQQARNGELKRMIQSHLLSTRDNYNQLAGYTHDYFQVDPWSISQEMPDVRPDNIKYGLNEPIRMSPGYGSFDDVEIASSMLYIHKNNAKNNMAAAVECADPNLRAMLMNFAVMEANHGYETFLFMNGQGLYQVPIMNNHTAKTFLHTYQPFGQSGQGDGMQMAPERSAGMWAAQQQAGEMYGSPVGMDQTAGRAGGSNPGDPFGSVRQDSMNQPGTSGYGQWGGMNQRSASGYGHPAGMNQTGTGGYGQTGGMRPGYEQSGSAAGAGGQLRMQERSYGPSASAGDRGTRANPPYGAAGHSEAPSEYESEAKSGFMGANESGGGANEDAGSAAYGEESSASRTPDPAASAPFSGHGAYSQSGNTSASDRGRTSPPDTATSRYSGPTAGKTNEDVNMGGNIHGKMRH